MVYKKKSRVYMNVLGIGVLTVLLVGHSSFAQTLSTDDTSTTTFIQINPQLLEVYCDNDVSKGTVTITEEPVLDLQYELEGSGVVKTLYSGDTVTLAAGEYYWRILSDVSLYDVEPVEGTIVVDDACGQTDTSGTDDSTSSSDGSTEEAPLPPESFDVLRENDTTFVLIDAGQNITDNLYAFRVYRRCEDATWWSIAKLSIEACGGYTCSHQVTDKSTGDTCEYAVSSMSETGLESTRTVGKYPASSDTDTSPTESTNDETATQETSTTNETSDPTEDPTTDGASLDTTGGVTTNVESTQDTTTTDGETRHVASGKYMIMLSTDDASHVEWVMYPKDSDTSTYLGKAQLNEETGFWEYRWDTTQVPNGDYTLVPKISSLSGRIYKDTPTYVQVKNDDTTTYTEEDRTLIDIVKEAAEEVEKSSQESDKEQEQQAKENVINVLEPYAKEVQEYVGEKGEKAVRQELIDEQERIKRELTTLLNIESSKLLRKLSGDEEEFKRFQNKVVLAAQRSTENIRKVAEEFGFKLTERELAQLEMGVEEKLEELEDVIRKRREVLKDRVGDRVFEDTDKDGISNYDEVHIYNTDPLKADTDNDGFFDGAEILGGFDPLSPVSEAVVEYEQPRTGGFIEEENFTVEEVEVTETTTNEQGNQKAEKIRLRGKAPANSFVTVYIYSDPIIVTVKTDNEGNWVYELDKELQDGSHEAYVAITDNAGRIYAKSRPLPFVKEAAAVTVDESALFNADGDKSPNFLSGAYVYIIILLIVAIIGWALVFTGSRQTRLESET